MPNAFPLLPLPSILLLSHSGIEHRTCSKSSRRVDTISATPYPRSPILLTIRRTTVLVFILLFLLQTIKPRPHA
jgi:hypothetical protein